MKRSGEKSLRSVFVSSGMSSEQDDRWKMRLILVHCCDLCKVIISDLVAYPLHYISPYFQ